MINFKEDLLFKANFSNTCQSRDLLRPDIQKTMPYQDDPRQAQGGWGVTGTLQLVTGMHLCATSKFYNFMVPPYVKTPFYAPI